MDEQLSTYVGWENPTNSVQSNIEKVGFSHPSNLEDKLPSIERIERELEKDLKGDNNG